MKPLTKEHCIDASKVASAPSSAPTDSERLDWLISRGAYVSHSRDGDVCNVWFSHDPDDDSGGPVPVEGYPQKCYIDAREAIDAAMSVQNNVISERPVG